VSPNPPKSTSPARRPTCFCAGPHLRYRLYREIDTTTASPRQYIIAHLHPSHRSIPYLPRLQSSSRFRRLSLCKRGAELTWQDVAPFSAREPLSSLRWRRRSASGPRRRGRKHSRKTPNRPGPSLYVITAPSVSDYQNAFLIPILTSTRPNPCRGLQSRDESELQTMETICQRNLTSPPKIVARFAENALV
jgi:hypothetical protein